MADNEIEKIKRLCLIRESLKINQQKMADIIGINRVGLSKIENMREGRRVPKDTSYILEEKLNINRQWFETGQGKMFKPSSTPYTETTAPLEVSDTDTPYQATTAAHLHTIAALQHTIATQTITIEAQQKTIKALETLIASYAPFIPPAQPASKAKTKQYHDSDNRVVEGELTHKH